MDCQRVRRSASKVRKRQTGHRNEVSLLALFLLFSLLLVEFSPQARGGTPGPARRSNLQAGSAASQEDVLALEPGPPLKRELEGGQQHLYQIKLTAGQFLQVIVEQVGIDLAVRVFEPSGKQILEFDSERRLQGPEPVSLVAESAGDYRLSVRVKQRSAAAGRYEIRIEALRAATENERELHEARLLYAQQIKLHDAGKYDEALPLIERALEIRTRLLGPDHRDVAKAINSLGLIYYDKGEYPKAEQLLKRALAIIENSPGPENPDLAQYLNSLALVYRNRGEYAKAEPCYQRALAIWKKTLGPQHLNVAYLLNNLADLYRNRGESEKAEPLLHEALSVIAAAQGPEHPDVPIALNNLGLLYLERGDYAKAEPVFKRALTILERALGPEHPVVATLINNLADLHRSRGELDQAEPLYRRVLAIREKALGPEHIETAQSHNNLGLIYRDRGELEKAAPFYQRALEIIEKTLGPENIDVATPLNNLAVLHAYHGDFAKAEPLFQRALTIKEKTLAPQHPDFVEALNNLARLYMAQGDLPQAVRFQSRANSISEQKLALNLATGSERQKLAYLALSSSQTNFTLWLHSQLAPRDPEVLNLALTTLLRRKGRGLDAMIDTIATLRRHAEPQDQELFNRLVEARSQLAALIFRGADGVGPQGFGSRIQPLEEEIETLETKLSIRRAEFRAQSQPVTIAAVQSALPADSALIEFVVYNPRDPQTGIGRPPRYLAYLLAPQGLPRWVDLGEAAPIDRAVTAWRQALRGELANVKLLGRAVDKMVMQPVRATIQSGMGQASQLLIAPDGSLNLIPFAALVDEKNHYLVERFTISYLTSGRDLLRLQTSSPSRNAPLILANPVFGRPSTLVARAASRSKTSPSGKRAGRQDGNQGQEPDGASNIYFQPLPRTRHEALAIKSVLPEASVLIREQATEAALKQASGPRILHIATHGFFLNDRDLPSAETGTALGENPQTSGLELSKWVAQVAYPLVRSGLALSGANQRREGDDDGVLTALEVAGLDLWGTKLVALSACDTGLGVVKNGEGVQGLRRALVLAGSESQVMSLWPVTDDGAKDLMVQYYRALQRGEKRSEGLRQVQLQMLRSQERRHPFHWAVFIQSGDWTNLDGQR
ncbi:MAG TPA: tetratricopeptide repeat protein [Blastocatellia bacterium]|nr:tetratricopeptide repeat protein [Blastocatellia bacterium]